MPAHHRYKPRSARHLALRLPALAAIVCVACTALTACSVLEKTPSAVNPVNWITPFRADIIQGNFISKEQVQALNIGMSRSQTKDVLGTPLLTSVFHEARWDYVFTFKRQGAEPQAYKYTVFFEGDRLVRFEGDTMPSEAEFLTKLDNNRKFGAAPSLEATQAQLKAAEKPSLAAPTSPAVPVTEPLTTAYPPLESPKQ